MILREEACLQIAAVKQLAAADEFNALEQSPLAVNDVHGPRLEVAAIRRARNRRAEFQVVCAHRVDRR